MKKAAPKLKQISKLLEKSILILSTKQQKSLKGGNGDQSPPPPNDDLIGTDDIMDG